MLPCNFLLCQTIECHKRYYLCAITSLHEPTQLLGLFAKRLFTPSWITEASLLRSHHQCNKMEWYWMDGKSFRQLYSKLLHSSWRAVHFFITAWSAMYLDWGLFTSWCYRCKRTDGVLTSQKPPHTGACSEENNRRQWNVSICLLLLVSSVGVSSARLTHTFSIKDHHHKLHTQRGDSTTMAPSKGKRE